MSYVTNAYQSCAAAAAAQQQQPLVSEIDAFFADFNDSVAKKPLDISPQKKLQLIEKIRKSFSEAIPQPGGQFEWVADEALQAVAQESVTGELRASRAFEIVLAIIQGPKEKPHTLGHKVRKELLQYIQSKNKTLVIRYKKNFDCSCTVM